MIVVSSGVKGAGPPRPPPRPKPRRRVQDLLADFLHSTGACSTRGGLDDRLQIGKVEQLRRQHRLDDDVGVAILGGGAIVRREAIDRRPCTASRSRESPGSRICGSASFISCADERRVERAEPFERPQRVNAGELIRPTTAPFSEALQRRDDRLVLLQDEELLRGVAPPAVRMAQMSDELRRRFVQHPWLSRVASHAVVAQPPDAPVADDLVELQLLDAPANVGARADSIEALR